MAMVNWLSKRRENCPQWLIQEDYSLRNFFRSRTVFYPGSGAEGFEADGTPIEVFNRSHSAHCYFYVDQGYSKMNVMENIGAHPTGYKEVFQREYSLEDLRRECTGELPVIAELLLESQPKSQDRVRDYLPLNYPVPLLNFENETRNELRYPADSESAIRLLVYQRKPDYEENHGADRFAVFLLGMEARTAYSWFYGQMFPNCPPFSIWIIDHGLGGDFARTTAHDIGFGDPEGCLYRESNRYGLPEFLTIYRNGTAWNGYCRVNGADLHDYSLWCREP